MLAKSGTLIVIIFFISFLQITLAQSFKKTTGAPSEIKISSLNINQILIAFNNEGGLGYWYPVAGASWTQLSFRDPNTGYDKNGNMLIYDQGIWILGKMQGKLHAAVSQWNTSFSPGPILDNAPAVVSHPEDSLKYRNYKITNGDDETNIDYKQWPSNWGAPADLNGKPLVKGDQTIWGVYNGYDSSKVNLPWWGPNSKNNDPFPVEVHQLAFAHKRGTVKDNVDVFANTIFLEWTIINKSPTSIDSTFIGLWNDIDLVNPYFNMMAIDTVNQLGYCYIKADSLLNSDYISLYERAAPSVGYVLLFGPVVHGKPSDEATFKGKMLHGFRNLSLSSFHAIESEPGYPPFANASNSEQAWNYANGLEAHGQQVVDPTTGKITKFQLSGNPINNQGWLYSSQEWSSGEAGFVTFTGPFNLAPLDTQWVMFALIPAEGNYAMESVKLLKEKAALLRSLPYDTLAYGTTPYKLNYIDSTNIADTVYSKPPIEFNLHQNYPNPFNSGTVIEFSLKETSSISLNVYNILGEKVRTLMREYKTSGEYSIQFNAQDLSSGVYFYQLKTDNSIQNKKMILLK